MANGHAPRGASVVGIGTGDAKGWVSTGGTDAGVGGADDADTGGADDAGVEGMMMQV
jgi:hypothetical protein